MKTLNVILFLSLLLPALHVHAQFSKGAKLLEPSVYFGSKNYLFSPKTAAGAPHTSHYEYQVHLGAGYFVMDNFEYLLDVSYGYNYRNNFDSSQVDATHFFISETYSREKSWNIQTGVRQYFHLHHKLYGGYFGGLYYGQGQLRDSSRIGQSGPALQFQTVDGKTVNYGLQANLFVNYQISGHFGLRYNFCELQTGISASKLGDRQFSNFEFEASRILFSSIGCYWLFGSKKLDTPDLL